MSLKSPLLALGLLAAIAVNASAAPELTALIVDGQMNPSHPGTKVTPTLKRYLEETGLFKVDVATSPGKGQDMSKFKPDFAAYDVVVMNYDGNDWSEPTKQAFVAYVRGGGGLVIYHSANNAFRKWKEFNEMIGIGGWGGRNEEDGPYVRWRDGKIFLDNSPGRAGDHGPQHEFALDVRAPNHPVTKGLPPVFMHSADELYNSLRGPAKNLTVLATSLSPKNQRGTGEHEPMLMDIRFGKGRVFHTTLGHAEKQIKSVAFIVTLQRGTEWAATGKVTQKVPADFPSADKPSIRDN